MYDMEIRGRGSGGLVAGTHASLSLSLSLCDSLVRPTWHHCSARSTAPVSQLVAELCSEHDKACCCSANIDFAGIVGPL